MRHRPVLAGAVAVALALGATAAPAAMPTRRASPAADSADAAPAPYFAIEVVDDATGRGVPLVELRTVNEIRYHTDSAGLVAFHEPGLMDRDVFFHVSSPGYEFPKDGFGFCGKALRTTPGATARLSLKRTNIAERLYRVTGQGIYRDTVLLGRRPPLRQPVLSGRVLGQDSVFALPYRDRLYWFWGDTSRESYPLGQFSMSGATSDPPGRGGLDPAVGIDLAYFVDADGFSRKMAPLPEPGMVWLDGLLTVNDESGRQRLVGHYARMKSLSERLEHGFMVYDDPKEVFERTRRLPDDVRLHPEGQATRVVVGGEAYWYFAQPLPMIRVRDNWRDVFDPSAYEAFTCLAPGSDYARDAPAIERGPDGRAVWGWKRNTAPVNVDRHGELAAAGRLRPEDAWIDLRDADTGGPVRAHRGCFRWNEYRKRYILIFTQFGGASFLGDLAYAEADAPEGPWRLCRRVATHPSYTVYNPVLHAFFDQEGGRRVYFEGTYTREFSDAKVPTPRYDYNQLMYRLDLADPRLALPADPARRAAP